MAWLIAAAVLVNREVERMEKHSKGQDTGQNSNGFRLGETSLPRPSEMDSFSPEPKTQFLLSNHNFTINAE